MGLISAEEAYTGPDVFEVNDPTEEPGVGLATGFYWQIFDKSVPTGEPHGPFATESAALADMQAHSPV
jgi:hypothetical protein